MEFIYLAIIIFVITLFGFIFLFFQKRKLGILTGKTMYSDSSMKPGKILYAKTIPLMGKPDFLIEKDNKIIPVEVKTGRTPQEPYMSHQMQLMAYCYLVEEQYGIRPPGGYIHYPGKEFPIAYTDDARKAVVQLVKELTEYKQSGKKFTCMHPEHQ